MCELAVRIVDKVLRDPYANARASKRGDVVVVVEDGHVWGAEELTHPEYTIVKVPGVPWEQALGFMAPEVDDHMASVESPMLQFRAFKFDLDAPRPTDYNSLMAVKIRKPKLEDPNVL